MTRKRLDSAFVMLGLPALLLLLAGLVVPLLLMVRLSLCAGPQGRGFYQAGTWTFDAYASRLTDPVFRGVLGFTLFLAVLVTLVTLLLAYPLALFLRTLSRRGKAVALVLVLLPQLAGALVTLFGLELALGRHGPINALVLLLGAAEPLRLTNNLSGVLVGEVSLLLPYAVLVLTGSLEGIDRDLAPAARGLGATPWQAFRRVTLPLSVPGLTLTGELCLIWALGAQLGPLLLGGPRQRTLAVEVERQAFQDGHWPRAAATAVLMLLTLAACVVLYRLPIWMKRQVEGKRGRSAASGWYS